MSYAGFWKRVAAAIIDGIITTQRGSGLYFCTLTLVIPSE